MSRKEDFIQAGIDYRMEHGKPMAIGGGNFAEMAREMNRARPFEAGCEHGYKYAVKKVCEWLEFGGRHYCPDCYSFDKDDENIVITKDGHKYNWETDEEIFQQEKESKE